MNKNMAFVFPGQGSQSVGMLADVALQYPEVQYAFAEASSVLNEDLWQLVTAGPIEKLNKTEYTQPALLAASYAVWKIISTRTQLKPALLAGHSLGEYTALVCAGAMNFTDAIKLVSARGRYMQEAVAEGVGAMGAIIGLDNTIVADICKEVAGVNEVISPANFNSIGQVVVAGHKAPVERALVLAKEKGASLAVLIPVSVPSHCALMKSAADKLAILLATIPLQPPQVPVVSNVTAAIENNSDVIRANLVKQLYMPVRWVETIQLFVKAGIDTVIECGPGKVLTGLNKRIDKTLTLLTTYNLENVDGVLHVKSNVGG